MSERPALEGALTAVARVVLAGFFRDVEVRGRHHLPAGGPVLVVANHANGLVDVALVVHAVGGLPRFVAKAVLWRIGPLRPLWRLLGLLPVVRAHDVEAAGPTGAAVNAGTFAVANRALAQGQLLAIFPEGTAHEELGLLPLRTGAARLALGARAEGATDLAIVPVGIIFEDKLALRSRALVVIGEPLALEAWVAAYGEPTADDTDRRAVLALTGELARRLGEVRPPHRDAEEASVLGRAAEVALRAGGDPAVALSSQTELAARLASAPEGLRREVITAFGSYQDRLDRRSWSDVEGAAVLDGRSGGRRRSRLGRVVAVAAAPATVAGLAVNLGPYLIVRAAAGLAHKPARRGTVRMMAALVTFPTTWVGVGVVVARRVGWRWGVATAMAAPLVGYAAVLEMEQVAASAVWRRGASAAAMHPAERAELGAARVAVVRAVGVAVAAEGDAVLDGAGR